MAKYKVLELDGNCLKIDLGRYKDCVDLSPLASDISANWGSIGGTLSAQTDLQTALNAKANTSALSGYLPITGGLLTGTAGNGKITFPTQSSAPSTPATGFSLYANAINALSWKGANGWVRTFDGIANTADRTYTLPDASGTFGLLGSTQTWSGVNTFSTFTDGFLTISGAQINRTSANIEIQFGGTGGVRYFANTSNPIAFLQGGLLGINTLAPTHSLTLGLSSTGFAHYNTSDQTTNYERIRGYWSGNVYTIGSENGGTGSARAISLVVGGRSFSIGGLSSVAQFEFISNSSNNFPTSAILGYNTANSGISTFFNITPTINQSGSGGYRGIFVSPYEQTTGSGSKLLLDLGTNSAANGAGTHTSKFSVDNGGNVLFGASNRTITNGAVIATNIGFGGSLDLRGSTGITYGANSIIYGQLFSTGRWFFGSSPTDDGVSTVNINGAVKVQGTLTVTTGGIAVNGTSSFANGVNFTQGQGYQLGRDGTAAGFYIYNTTLGQYQFVVKETTGNVLIGTTTDDGVNQLQVNGPIKSTSYLDSTYVSLSGATSLNVPSAGVLRLGASGVFTSINTQKSMVVENTLTSTQYRLSELNTAPSSPIDKGTLGEIRVTSTYIYVCTATNVWVRTDLTSW